MRAALVRVTALGALLLFLFFGDVPERSRFWSAFFDAGHTALFGVSALLIRGLLRDARQPRPSLAAFAITVALGGATELLQMLQRRGDPSVADLLRDTAGAAAFLLLAAAAAGRPARAGRAVRPALVVAAAAILLAAGWTLLDTSAAYIARNRSFPTLFAFNGSRWERTFIDLENNSLTPEAAPPTAVDGSPTPLARLDLRPAKYSGISFEEVYPDWRGRRRLTFTIVSDLPSPLPMGIRIHDARHDQRYRDRFNRRLIVQPGVNRFAITTDDIRLAPDRREMDLRHVRTIVLFAPDLDRPAHVYLGPLVMQ